MSKTLIENRFKIIKWYDGDTATGLVDLGFGITKKERIRLARIQAPELNGETTYQVRRAIRARNIVRKICPKDNWVSLFSINKDKYGRYICEVFVNKINLSNSLMKNYPKLFKKY